MSGICGVISHDKQELVQPIIETMIKAGIQRGPDGSGEFVKGAIGLGQLCLHIFPRHLESSQPVSSEDGRFTAVLDGSISNYDQVLASIETAFGRSLQNPGYAALFLAAYEAFGSSCLERIDGTFAVAIWDEREKKLFAARDRMGIKPFFYAQWGQIFLFASEITQILAIKDFPRRPNDAVIGTFLVGDVDLSHETFFDGIFRLQAGSFINVSQESFQRKVYWDIDPSRQTILPNDEAYGERFLELFQQSVDRHLQFVDVPLASNLSGGLDSSSIVCITDRLRKSRGETSPLDTFSLAFEDKAVDEGAHVQAISTVANIQHHQYLADEENVFSYIPMVQQRQAEPFRSMGIVLFWRLKQLASQSGFKVLLNGMGADEVLGGINLYYLADLLKEGKWSTLNSTLKALAVTDPFALGLSPWGYLRTFGFRPLIPDKIRLLRGKLRGNAVPDFLDQGFTKRTDLAAKLCTRPDPLFKDHYRQMSYEGAMRIYTPLLMHYEDTNNATFGLESRFPFLDRELVEFLFSIPLDQKMRNGVAKIVLRNGMKGILPDSVRTRTDKGFIDKRVDHWLRQQYSQDVENILWGEQLKSYGYFDSPRLHQLYRDYQAGSPGRFTIWKSYNVGVWLRTFFN